MLEVGFGGGGGEGAGCGEGGDDVAVAGCEFKDSGARGAEGGDFLAGEEVVGFPVLGALEDAGDAAGRVLVRPC